MKLKIFKAYTYAQAVFEMKETMGKHSTVVSLIEHENGLIEITGVVAR